MERELVDLNGSDVVCVVADDELSIIQHGDEEVRLGPDSVHALLEEIASSPVLRDDMADVWEAAVLAARVPDPLADAFREGSRELDQTSPIDRHFKGS